MIDENAFGLMISYFGIEDDEYGGEREDFVDRYATFAALVRERLTEAAPGASARALDLGHAFYVELLADDPHADPIAWLKATRARLEEHGYRSVALLAFGSSWLDAADPRPDLIECGSVRLARGSGPSEPLRRCLLGATAAEIDEDAAPDGWGPGLYLDVEAVEALGKKPKNAPTVLTAGSARFYRAGS